MTVNIFGQTIDVPRVNGSGKYFDEKLKKIVERKEERRVMRGFLDDRSLAGKIRFEEIVDKVRTKVEVPDGELDSQQRDLATRFYIERLKSQPSGQADSLYHDLALRLVRNGKRASFRKQLDKLQRKKIAVTDLPDTFPGEFKKAETLLVGKIRSEIGRREYQSYLHHKELLSQLRVIAQDLFYGINSGLSPEEVERYMAVRFELRKLQESVPTNSRELRKTIVRAIRSGKELTLIHLKCLRYTYPRGESLVLIDHMGDVQVETKTGGTHLPRSEKDIFSRLDTLVQLFKSYGIDARLLVLISDQDLIDFFGPEQEVFTREEIEKAYRSMTRYKNCLSEAARNGKVAYFRKYLKDQGYLRYFEQKRKSVLRELKTGKSDLPESYVESCVDYRCEADYQIFVEPPKRKSNRLRVYKQLASNQALGVLRDVQGGLFFVVEDDRGNANSFIGGVGRSALPVYFTKLRDKAEVL